MVTPPPTSPADARTTTSSPSTERLSLRTVARAAGGTLAGAFIAAIVVGAAFVALPLPHDLLDATRSSSLRILARDGAELRVALSPEGARSIPLDAGMVPPRVAAAFIAAEDRRFATHIGIDVRAIVRALRDSVQAGHVVSGASTIPQQLARRVVQRGPGLIGKLREAMWAMRLRAHLHDDELLRAYLDRVPLGRNTVGVEAASRAYFGVGAATLSTSQAAMLAGLAHAPAREDPSVHPASARARRDEVLRRMHAMGAIDDDAWTRGAREEVEARPRDGAAVANAPAPHDAAGDGAAGNATRDSVRMHETMHVTTELLRRAPANAIAVRSTIDTALQHDVTDIVRSELVVGPQRARGVQQAAVVVVDNASGEVLAWVGSAAYDDVEREGQNDGVLARRQPGSALKPFVYGLGLARGMTPATLLHDVETGYALDHGTYVPRNYDKRSHGPVRLRAALQNSYNVPAVEVASRLGPARILDELRAFGFTSLDRPASHYGVGIVLGNGEVTPLEMAGAWRALARGGVYAPLVTVRAYVDGHGREHVAAAPAEHRVLPRDVVNLLTHILSDTGARTPEFGFDNALDLPFAVAAKTGTSRAWVDNWTAGFTAERTVVVWAGAFDGTPMRHVAAIAGAGVIFRRVMLAAMRGLEPAPLVVEDGLQHARICALSGERAGPHCRGVVDEVFLPGTAPTRRCSIHIDEQATLALPARLLGWAHNEGIASVLRDNENDNAHERAMPRPHASPAVDVEPHFLTPADGDVFAIDPGLPGDQEVPVLVQGARAGDVIVDEDGTTWPAATRWLPLARGRHRIALHRGEREGETRTFEVR